MSQFVYQGPMGQGGESRALAQDQYEEDQRMLNKSQQREKYASQVPGYDDPIDQSEQFAPMSSSPNGMGQRRGTVLRVSSAQKKRPPAQGVQGYEEDDSQRPTLKYDNVYQPNTVGKPGVNDPFSNEYAGVAPYRKGSQRQSDMPRSEKTSTAQYTRPQQQVPTKISNYGPIRLDDDEDDQYNSVPPSHAYPDNAGNVSRFAQPMPANRQQQRPQGNQPAPVHSKYAPRRFTEQKPRPSAEDYDGLLSPQQNEDLIRRHEKAIQDEIQQLQNESRSYRHKSSPRNARKQSPIRSKYVEDQVSPQSFNEFKAPAHRPMTDVKSIKVTKSRTNSNVRQRPQEPAYRPVNSYGKPLKVISAKVEQTDNELPDHAFKPHEANIQESPRMKAYSQRQQPIEDEDVLSLQDQINRDYENKLKEVNDEAVTKLKEVQEEHRKILQKTQELYSKKKEVDDLERQFNAMNKNKQIVPLHDPIIQMSNNQSMNTQQMSFLNYSNRPDRQQSGERPYYVKSGKPQKNRDDSRNTFQMLNDLSDYDRSASRGRYSRMSHGMKDEYPENNFGQNFKGNNAMKLRDLYREFCDAVNTNKQRNYRHQHEICLHDVLMDMFLIGPDTDDNLMRQATEGTENTALSTENVRVQKQKFSLPLRTEVQHFDEHAKEDVLKNLFKILCGVMNMGLKQRGINMIDTPILKQYLDSINFNIQDNDLILLNQLAAIKGLANRKAFSLSEQHLSMIHIKFKNLYEQRQSSKDQQLPQQVHHQPPPSRKSPFFEQPDPMQRKGGSTIIMGQKSDIDRYTPVQVKRGRPGNDILPRELQYHELEESREYRESRQGGYKPHRVKSKPYGSAVLDNRRPPVEEDTIERYRPAEYRRPEKHTEDSDPDTDEAPRYDQFKPQRHARPSARNESPAHHDPYYYQHKPIRKSRRPPEEDPRDPRRRSVSNPRGSRSNSHIGRGSHLAPEASPQRRRGNSPNKLDNIQDFLNARPQASNNKKPNPNQSGIGRQYRDVHQRSGLKDPRYDDYEPGRSPGRGGRGDREQRYRSPDSRYSGHSGYDGRGMSHGGYNM